MKSPAFTRSEAAARRAFAYIRTHIVLLWLIAMPFLLAMMATRNWSEITQVGATMRGAEPRWLLAGFAIEAAIMLSPVLTYHVILRRLGHRLAFSTLTDMHMQRIVVGAVAPVSGPAGAVVFIRALNRRAVTTSDALTLLAMRSVATQIAFFAMVLGVIALHGRFYALGAGTLLVVLFFGAVPLVRRSRLPVCIGPWRWRKLPRPVACSLIAFAARFRRHHIQLTDLVQPVMITVATRFTGIVLLAVSIKAMGVDVAPHAIAAAVVAETLATIAVPIFHGIGVVEAATALALQQSGIPAEAAIGASLLWRAFTFWMPLSVALSSQAIAFGVERLRRASFPALPAPQPALVPAMVEAPGVTRRRLVTRVFVVLGAVVLGRAAGGASDLG